LALAMVTAGFSTMAAMNSVQPLLPIFSHDMGVSAASASLSLSLSIQALALTMPVTGAISELTGRKNVMAISLFLSAVLMMLSASAPSWNAFLVYRTLQGIAFSGVPAVAIAYMSEEVDPAQRGYAVGLYVSGGAFGGMGGRVVSAVLVDHGGWRGSLLCLGLVGLLSAAAFVWLLPASRHFSRQPIRVRVIMANYRAAFSNAQQRALFLLGFAFMGCLVTTYNYVSYRLVGAPFHISHTLIGLLFVTYVFGIVSSTVAGGLADRFGKKKVLLSSIAATLAGMLAMTFDHIPSIVAGLILFTGGVFAAHAVASGWVSANAEKAKAQASAIYLLFYYTGGAIVGWLGGYVWHALQWRGITMIVIALLLTALAMATRLEQAPSDP
jgi:YNFM family putative membrane transporter